MLLPPAWAPDEGPTVIRLEEADIAARLPRRALTAHKNSLGSVGVIAGSLSFSGAAVLTATATLRRNNEVLLGLCLGALLLFVVPLWRSAQWQKRRQLSIYTLLASLDAQLILEEIEKLMMIGPTDARHCAGETDYGGAFASAIARDNIFATQFHPEKSAEQGLMLYRNFLHWNP